MCLPRGPEILCVVLSPDVTSNRESCASSGIVIQANRFARILLEESVKYACKRKTFGKPLIEHPVIRAKIASMAQRIEATHAWLEHSQSLPLPDHSTLPSFFFRGDQ